MGRAWRIVKNEPSAAAFGGEGARRYGGRWNSTGTSVVYTSGSKALAALEVLVHINPHIKLNLVAIQVKFDDALVEKYSALPSNWKAEPPSPQTQTIGDIWVDEGRSAILELPSVLIPEEPNYLLNPAHPDFKKIVIHPPEPFSFDSRLL